MSQIYALILSAAVSLAIGFGGGWTTNGWRLGAEISQLQAQQAINLSNGLKTALDQTTRYQRTKDEALKKAESRAAANAVAAAAVRSESDGLRQQLESARSGIPQATHDSLRRYAATGSFVAAFLPNRHEVIFNIPAMNARCTILTGKWLVVMQAIQALLHFLSGLDSTRISLCF